MPSLFSIFPQSGAVGDGLGTRAVQKVINDMGVGAMAVTILHSGSGIEKSQALTTIDSHTFDKGDFEDPKEQVFLVIMAEDNSTGGVGTFRLRIATPDGSMEKNLSPTQGITKEWHFGLNNDTSDNTSVIGRGYSAGGIAEGLLNFTIDASVGLAEWIKTPWTISLLGNTGPTGGEFNYAWWVYKRGFLL